ncbi:MAG: helix-turn-helix transcriptional regulator [Roseovarius sp.]|uniref:helix-turn-helix domain-containing protein n=1 Tax=Roseovarius sp. TaxID=1486281 RepID=UPI0032EDD1B9
MKNLVDKLIPHESRPERVGPRVTALRETMAMSKAQLADSIGLDRSTLTKIEKGAMGLDIQRGEAIAHMYGFGLDFIYRGDLSDVPDKYRDRLLIEMVTYNAR